MDSTLKFHLHVSEIAAKGSEFLILLSFTVCDTQDFTKLLFITHINPLLNYVSVVWLTGYLASIRLLEMVQWRRDLKGTHL